MSAGAGIFSDAMIEALAGTGAIAAPLPLVPGQVQPASLDLRLGRRCWRMRASFLPGQSGVVARRIEALSLHEIDLTGGAVLETGCVYVAEVLESMALPPDVSASANPKSSTGRLDVFTRVIADGTAAFDTIPAGYAGPVFAEISPRTFPVLVRTGSRLSQVRFRRGVSRIDDAALAALHARSRLVDRDDALIQDGVALSVDLAGFGASGLVGYRGKRHTGLVDVDRVGAYPVAEFWEPIHLAASRDLVLDPGEFYILASKEAVHVPPDHAAEMVPFDAMMGEFRVHYAGFFDPGFGHAAAGGSGARAVLEVRSRDVPFIIGDGQVVGRLIYERMAAPPRRLYGADLASNYQAQGLKLSKHFRD
ncbi:MAG: 2'-deoxycytidine 5'-triphosphate deaminase [Hyphomicrobiales bacterium]|nr:2'-deoxycytidine 5'-triphosphate deaminase [Hyphomicrobiales bacterium]MCA1999038.1 2'-deoxycytidine 5'-triphosphate deaminase [Hyphomicrobiales bacterium]